MEPVRGFFDYCISEKIILSGKFEETAQLLVELGYRTVAINQVVNESNLEPKKKKKKGESRDVSDIIPPPIEIKKLLAPEGLKILNRLTIIFSNQEIMHKVTKSPNYKKYHIFSVLPLTQSALQFTSTSVEADIISFDSESKISYKISRKLYNQLIDRGFHFEILYSPAIRDSTHRKNIIHMSHLYHAFGKSRNVIISSGASDIMHIRSPYDIVNLGLIFGLGEDQAKNAISHFGKKVFIHSVGRRHGKAVMFIENTQPVETDEVQDSDAEMDLDQPAQKKTKQ